MTYFFIFLDSASIFRNKQTSAKTQGPKQDPALGGVYTWL